MRNPLWYKWFFLLLAGCCFSLAALNIFKFAFSFQKLNYDMPGISFLVFILVGACCSASWICGLCLSKIWEIFSHYLFECFSNPAPVSSASGTLKTGILDFCSTGPWGSIYFLILIYFFLFFMLGYFYHSVFKFTGSFCCSLHSTVELIHWAFNISYYIFQFWNSIWFFLISSIYLLKLSNSLMKLPFSQLFQACPQFYTELCVWYLLEDTH